MDTKFLKTVTLVFLSLGVFSGCNNFLDEQPTNVLPAEVIFSSTTNVDAYLSGINRLMRAQYTSSEDAGGVYSLYFARTVRGNDFIVNGGAYSLDYSQINREANYRRPINNWRMCFDFVNQANMLIEGVTGSSTLSDADKLHYQAVGKVLRAYFYFQLALDFQQTYTYDKSLISLPIYMTPSKEGKAFSSLEDVYNLIKSDLRDAVNVLDDERLGKSYINLKVAEGILARVLLVTQDNWVECANMANHVYGGNVETALSPSTYGNGFDDINNSEWVWGLDQQDNQSNYYYMAPHSFIDHEHASYSNVYVNSNFVANFTPTDVRNLFYDKYQTSAPWSKFVSTKFKFSFACDAPLMRTAEMILVESEALFHQGKEQEAHNLLFKLQHNRDPNAVISSNTGDALFNEILLERRKELYGELGVEYFDSKRLRRGLTRDTNQVVQLSLLPDDKKFVLKVSQKEIDANPNITEEINSGK